MKSVSGKNWEEINISRRLIDKVKIENNLSEIAAKLVISRKFNRIEIESINNKISLINPFLRNKDFEVGYDILNRTIQQKKNILIIGDYDVDGCVSTSLFINLFKEIKQPYYFIIPNRFKDGYGASLKLVKNITKKKIDLVIMVDCGSNSHDVVNYLKDKNVKTIIVDHHEINKPYPKSDCLINPKKECNYNDLDYLCSSSITYFFINYYIKKKKLSLTFDKNLVYVLLSTITDVMPLRKINRILAINVIRDKYFENFIFKKILELKNINRPLNIEDLGFLIGPILNSAGRLSDPNIVVKLLTSSNKIYTEKILNKLIEINEKRKKIEINSILDINLNKIRKENPNVICIYENIFNEGIIGIIASRLKDFFDKPSIVLTKIDQIYKASARSTENFNIGKLINKGIENMIIQKGGGHNLAAGFSIQQNKILKFKRFINEEFEKVKKVKFNNYLSKISIDAVNNDFYKNMQKIAPFGYHNDDPIYLIESINIIKPKVIKRKYIQFYVKSKKRKTIPGISFNLIDSKISENILNNKNEMNLLVQIKENHWKNKKNLQLIIRDVITFSNNT